MSGIYMPILDDLIKRKPKTQVMMTPLGKQKMEEKNVQPNTADGKILWYIRDHTQANLAEIADETGISYVKTKDILNKYASPELRWLEWV